MTGPAISVVVPVRDDAASLRVLLASLGRQMFPRDRFEIVVVDNASRDETAEVAREMGARVVHEPVPNRARARNAGVAAAGAPLLAFTDADCVALPGWLAALSDRAGSTPLIAGKVSVMTGEPPNRIERFERLWRFEQEGWVAHLGWAATANLLVERGAFEAVGGFDPAYRHTAEDVDFCIRAGRAGHALGYCSDAAVTHVAEDRRWPMLKRSFWHGYGSVQVSRRVGAGYRAWAKPGPLLDATRAAAKIGIDRDGVPMGDWGEMRSLSRQAYGMRVAGSLWAELRRAR
jgi:GT2 family glycosyltransferase